MNVNQRCVSSSVNFFGCNVYTSVMVIFDHIQKCALCLQSWSQNRGRLASKCNVSPTSPAKKRKEPSKSVSSWRNDGFEVGMPFPRPRHYSSSDVDRCVISSASNGAEFRDTRDSNSSTTSDCSEVGDDSPFTPAGEAKRPRSASPENSNKSGPMKRRSSKSDVWL